MVQEFPAGVMPDYRAQLSPWLAAHAGRWTTHEELAPGVLCHRADDGTECISVRVLLPAGGFLSAATLRRLADWVRAYAEAGRRTSRQAFEFVGVKPGRLDDLLAELKAAGFPVGGTGRTLHQIKCCSGFVHCQNAAADAPAIARDLAEALFADIAHPRYPAPLRVAVSGCPNQCGSAPEADIGIVGVFADPPRVDDRRLVASRPDLGLLRRWCPSGAVRTQPAEGGSTVVINEARCSRCTSCVQVAPEGIAMGDRRGVAVLLGGRGPSRGGQSRLARTVVEYLPVAERGHEPVVAYAAVLVEWWVSGARPGERMADYLDRVGWEQIPRPRQGGK